MANNPIFSKTGSAQWNAANITAANTAKDGTGTVDIIQTAPAVTGSYIQKIIIRPRGTNVATVMRLFINNGSANTTASNNSMIGEISLAATTLSEVSAIAGSEYPLNLPMAPNHRLFVTLGTAVAAGFSVTTVGGDY